MELLKKILISITIIVFMLPFVPPGCADMSNGNTKTEEPIRSAMTNIDTTAVTVDTTTFALKDTSSLLKGRSDSISIDTSKINKAPVDAAKDQEMSIPERIFISPDTENLSGTGYLINYFTKEYFFAFFSYLFLWVVMLKQLFKIRIFAFDDKWLLLTGICLLLLLVAFRWDRLLWGFWVMLGLYGLTTLLFYINSGKKDVTEP